MSDAHGHAPAPSGGGAKSGGSGGGHGGGGGNFSIGIFGFIVFLLAFYFLLYKPQHKNENVRVVTKEYKEVYDYSIEVNFSNEYAASVDIGDKKFAFSRASVPYCTKNLANLEKCGEANESVARYFSYTSSNRTFWFKATCDSIGKIYIDIFKDVEIIK